MSYDKKNAIRAQRRARPNFASTTMASFISLLFIVLLATTYINPVESISESNSCSSGNLDDTGICISEIGVEEGDAESFDEYKWEDDDDDEDDDDEDDDEVDDDISEEVDECVDDHETCSQWADEGECIANPSYMIGSCRRSCGVCVSSLGNCKEENLNIGVEQDTADNELILRAYRRSLVYKCDQISSSPEFASIEGECINKHALCSFWESVGECETNPNMMQLDCALACKSCLYLDNLRTCPVQPETNALKPGDLNSMFERITDLSEGSEFAKYKPAVLSGPPRFAGDRGDDDYLIGPWVVTFDEFLTEEECDRFVELGAEKGYIRSTNVGKPLFGGSSAPSVDESRTSYNAWCGESCYQDPIAKNAIDRMVNFTGVPERNQEYIQLLKYDVGQFYKDHHDYIPIHSRRAIGPRVLTFFLYLNDVEAGGGTAFSKLGNLTVVPKKGKALLWPSVLDENPNLKDDRTHHEALPVFAGLKYGANAWIHLRDFKGPYADGCI